MWLWVRVSTTLFPRAISSFRPNQSSSSWRVATGPMTKTTGGLRVVPSSASPARVVRSVLCSTVVPFRTAATGVSGDLPASRSLSAVALMRETPMRTTMFSGRWTQSMAVSSLSDS